MSVEQSGNPSIAHQSTRQLGGEGSVLVRQRRDHAELDHLMGLYESGAGSPAHRQAWLRDIVQLTFSHAFAEEVVLWPVLRRVAAAGQELTSRVEEEHQEINDLVAGTERLEAGDPRREELVKQAFALIRQDIRDEEDLLLPHLQQALSAGQLRRLGAVWESVRRSAPTRPHPAVPRRPPGNAVLGVPLSVFDRARDLRPAGAGEQRRGKAVAAAALGACLLAAATAAVAVRRAVPAVRRRGAGQGRPGGSWPMRRTGEGIGRGVRSK